MGKKKVYKCSSARRELCVNLTKFAADQYGSGRRIFIGQSLDRKGNQGVRVWYAFGSKRNEFVIMLYCPWCKGRLGWKNKRKPPKEKVK